MEDTNYFTIKSENDIDEYNKLIISAKRKKLSIEGDSITYEKTIIVPEKIIDLTIKNIRASFLIQGAQLTVMKMTNVYSLSEYEVDLPNAVGVFLLHSNINTVLGVKKIKKLTILDAPLPKNFSNEEIHLDLLTLCTNKKIDKIPNAKDIDANFDYGRNMRSYVSYPVMSCKKMLSVIIYDYIHPCIYDKQMLTVRIATKDLNSVFEFVQRGQLNIVIPSEGKKMIDIKLLYFILQKYDICKLGSTILLTRKITRDKEFFRIKSPYSLCVDVLAKIFNYIADKKTRFIISRLLVKNFNETFRDIIFEEDMDKIYINTCDKKKLTAVFQRDLIHAERLEVHKKIKIQQSLADRITHLTLYKIYAKMELSFPNLVKLEYLDCPDVTLKIDNLKLKYLTYYEHSPHHTTPEFLGISERIFDLSIFPNLVKLRLKHCMGISTIINPNNINITLSQWILKKNKLECGNSPLYIKDCSREMDEIIDICKRYNIVCIQIYAPYDNLYIKKIREAGYRNNIKIQTGTIDPSQYSHIGDGYIPGVVPQIINADMKKNIDISEFSTITLRNWGIKLIS